MPLGLLDGRRQLVIGETELPTYNYLNPGLLNNGNRHVNWMYIPELP
jgi:hypothetical protein